MQEASELQRAENERIREEQIERMRSSQGIYLDWLREHVAYPHGFFLGYRFHIDRFARQRILIITVENNYPTIKTVNIFNGELMIYHETLLDNIIYGVASFDFRSDHGTVRFQNDHFRRLYFRHVPHGQFGQYRFVEMIDGVIPEEVFILSKDNQKQFAGNFVFDSFQIINQQNYEITESFIENFNREISVFLDEDGFLIGRNFNVRNSSDFENLYFMMLGNYGVISTRSGDGTTSGFSERWYFADVNTIYYRYSWHTGDDDFSFASVSYTVRYIRQ